LRLGCSSGILLISMGLCSAAQTDAIRGRVQLGFKVPPGASSALSFNAGPNAQCMIRAQNAKDSEEGLPVFADDNGTTTFYVEPAANATGSAKLVASCSSGTSQIIEVEAVPGTKPLAYTQIAPDVQHRGGKHVRPALSGDPMALSSDELMRRGYPPRPDPVTSPDDYAGWLRAVSKPATQIEPKLVKMPRRYHGPVTIENAAAGSSNWSGYSLVGNSSPFDFISGNWSVPVTYGSQLGKAVYSALWIGLDGYGSNNVVQDGTGQDVFSFVNGTGPDVWIVRAYYGWKEICCQEPEVRFSNFTVNPGDQISSYVWMGDSSGATNAFGNIAYFWFEDVTTGQYASVSTVFASGVYSGNSAEWIMERPTVNDSMPDLANYSSAGMSNPWAHRADNRWYGYTGGDEVRSQQITMFNGGNPLSTVSPIDNDHMQFQWLAYH
jgi:hypothetical protein